MSDSWRIKPAGGDGLVNTRCNDSTLTIPMKYSNASGFLFLSYPQAVQQQHKNVEIIWSICVFQFRSYSMNHMETEHTKQSGCLIRMNMLFLICINSLTLWNHDSGFLTTKWKHKSFIGYNENAFSKQNTAKQSKTKQKSWWQSSYLKPWNKPWTPREKGHKGIWSTVVIWDRLAYLTRQWAYATLHQL